MNKKRNLIAQSMLEFALILPMAFLLLIGFIDIGRAVFYYSTLTNAAREGARAGIVNHGYLVDVSTKADIGKLPCPSVKPTDPTIDSLRCIVYRYAFGLTNTLNPQTDIVPTVTFNDVDPTLFQTVTISVNYCFVPATTGITLLVNQKCNGKPGINLNVQSTMWVEPSGR